MKKLLSCLLAMALALTLLAGCSADEPASGAQPAATPAPHPHARALYAGGAYRPETG